MNYYNEHDPKAAAWLRELITAGLITPGDVDERSIIDVNATDLLGYVQCHFFAGIGGWSYALRLAGWPDDRPVWTGSCPCQPFSGAGKGEGGDDPRHLWPAWFRLVKECRPDTVFGEQVAGAIGHGWLDLVSTDLEGEGYACGTAVLGAHSVGAPHIRQRLYWVADAGSRTSERDSGAIPGAQTRVGGEDRAQHGDLSLGHRNGSPTGLLADAPALRSQEHDGDEMGRVPEQRGATRGMGHADQPGPQGRLLGGDSPGERALGAAGLAVGACASGLAITDGDGNRSHGCGSGTAQSSLSDFDRQKEPGAGESGGAGDSIRGVTNGFWRNADWLPCRDGKTRPTQPGLFPLVARLPRELVPSGDPSESYAQASTEARVMRLRGYGNAIVPAVAAEVIKAYRDVLGENLTDGEERDENH